MTASTRLTTLRVPSMHCASCVARIEQALEAAGVKGASANLATRSVQVLDRAVDANAALEAAGYPPERISRVFEVQGMSCASCVARIETALRKMQGVTEVAVNFANSQLRVEMTRGLAQVEDLQKALKPLGYQIGAEDDASRASSHVDTLRRDVWLSAFLAIPVVVLEMGAHVVPAFHHWLLRVVGDQSVALISFVLAALVLFVPGRVFFRVGVPALLRRAPDMNALVALGAGAAFAYSSVALFLPGLLPETARVFYFETVVVIVTLVLLGRWLEARARGRAGAAVRALIERQPQSARVQTSKGFEDRPIAEISLGDLIQIPPGARLPVDGIVAEGVGYVDEAMLTGEPIPVKKPVGAEVAAGTVNQTGAMVIEATAVGQNTVLAEIARMVTAAQATKMPIQRLVDQITAYFVPAVLVIAALTVTAWIAFGGGVDYALAAGVSVLVIACPCAMGLATPISIMMGTNKAASVGVLFRRSAALQRLASVGQVAFDKTGTLTIGRPRVTEVSPSNTASHYRLLSAAISVEAQSEHPLAKGILAFAEAQGLTPLPAQSFRAEPGLGASAKVSGKTVRVGSADFMGQSGTELPNRDMLDVGSAVCVSEDGEYLGRITLQDTARAEAPAAISELRGAGISTAIVSGDRAAAVSQLGDQLGIAHTVSDLSPTGKADAVAKLQAKAPLAFVGDGINDAPALALADVGVAIGTGADVAIETADVVLRAPDLYGVVRAYRISRATMRNIRQNLGWAFGYNILLIPVAAGVLYPGFGLLLSPGLAAGAMGLSSVAVVLNALRLGSMKI